MAMYPSSSMPSYQSLAARVRGMDVNAPFNQAAGEMARGRAMNLEALDKQRVAEEQAAMQQAQDRGMEILGGNLAAQNRYRDAVQRGGQQYDQAVAQMAPQRLAAQMQQEQLAGQYETRYLAQEHQLRLAALQRAEAERNRQLQRDLAKARNAQQADIARASATRDVARIRLAARQSSEQIAASRARRGAGGGGGGMSVNYSTGARNFEDHLRKMGVM